MNNLKKLGMLLLLLCFGALNLFFYWNSHLYYRARNEEDLKKRIRYLEESNEFCPLNDLVLSELGKSYYDLGMQSLSDPETSESYFQKAVHNLKRSIMINPASPYAHYHLGRALLNLDFFTPQEKPDFYEEFKIAAKLAGDDSQIYSEVGKLFFSRWNELSEEDRLFTLDLVRRMSLKGDMDQIDALLNIWELNIGDYEVMEMILPEDVRVYRRYADFLGEKSLSLAERHKFLAKAEFMDFEKAREEIEQGDIALFHYQIQKAIGHFRKALDLLRGIKFYQSLSAQNLFNKTEFNELMKTGWLNQIRCRVEEGVKLTELENDFFQYLALEDQPKEIGDLETYLRNRGILPQQPARSFDDLGLMAFELFLQYKQMRYRDIISLGRGLKDSFVVVPEAKKADYVRVLQLIGNSFQKIDYLYDADDIYQKALELNPQALGILLRIRENYLRLNEERKLREIESSIDKILTPREIRQKSPRLEKGKTASRSLTLDGQKIFLDLHFGPTVEGDPPLVAIFFNGQVVWEDFMKDELLTLNLETREGENLLQVLPVNRPVSLVELTWRPANENIND